jgi:hypothetical protein
MASGETIDDVIRRIINILDIGVTHYRVHTSAKKLKVRNFSLLSLENRNSRTRPTRWRG